MEGGLRDVGGVLEQRGVAGHEGGGCEADDLPEREVPRHHGEDGAERPVAHQGPRRPGVPDVGVVGVFVGEQPLGVGGVPAHRLGALGGLRAGGRQGLAHLGGHGPGDVPLVLVEEVGRPVQQPGPFVEAGGAVGAERSRGGGDPLFDLLFAQCVERPERLTVGGVDRRDGHGCGLLGLSRRPGGTALCIGSSTVPRGALPRNAAPCRTRTRPVRIMRALGTPSAPAGVRHTSAAAGRLREVRPPGSGVRGSGSAGRGVSA